MRPYNITKIFFLKSVFFLNFINLKFFGFWTFIKCPFLIYDIKFENWVKTGVFYHILTIMSYFNI
jgi:hypothetical protein